MRLIVNGEKRDIDAATLAGALRALDYGEAELATALNGELVPARARAATAVKEDDRAPPFEMCECGSASRGEGEGRRAPTDVRLNEKSHDSDLCEIP